MNLMDTGNILGQMVEYIKAYGKKIKCTDMENFFMKMAVSIKENS